MDKLLSDSREDALMYTFENILDVNLVYIFEEDGLVLCSYDNTVIYVAEWRGF